MGSHPILDKLAAKARNDQERAVVERLVRSINIVRSNHQHVPVEVADTLREDYQSLLESQFWNEDELDARVVRRYVWSASAPKVDAEDRSAGFSLLLPLWNTASGPKLPMELMDSLERTYFLHTLAVRPQSILPPGKNLISALASIRHGSSQPETGMDVPMTVTQQVEKAVHRAFWDEVSFLVILTGDS